MTAFRPLILDLDGTLLHTEAVAGLVVPGRTRPAYLSAAVIGMLRELSMQYAIVLATARSWAGTRPVTEGLAAAGVPVEGLVLEDGGIVGQAAGGGFAFRRLEPERDWPRLRRGLEPAPDWPAFDWQLDFEACLVARAETVESAAALAGPLYTRAAALEAALRGFRDGRKVYLAGRDADKRKALEDLLADRLAVAAGIGDGPNDAGWLAAVAVPATFQSAPAAVRAAVRTAGGIETDRSGHAGICDLLAQLAADVPA